MNLSIRMALAITLLFANAVPALAVDVSVEVIFSQQEATAIKAWFRESEGFRGKARKSLPPGIAKKLARGKPLPPGIAKEFLPEKLTARLPPVREGFERVIVDGKVLLVEVATQMVHDVLSDVILR